MRNKTIVFDIVQGILAFIVIFGFGYMVGIFLLK